MIHIAICDDEPTFCEPFSPAALTATALKAANR